MSRDTKRVKPGVLHGLRGNEFGENYAGTKYRLAIDKSPIKNHK